MVPIYLTQFIFVGMLLLAAWKYNKLKHPMRQFFLSIFMLIAVSSFGQEWIKYQVDSAFTLSIPDNYEVTDTLGQTVVSSVVDNGLILVSIMRNEGKVAMNIEDEEDLIKSYKGFQEGTVDSQKGQIIKEEIIDQKGLKCLRFSYKATMGDEKQIRHCFTVFVNRKVYAVNFWELESMTNEMAGSRRKLFSSLTFLDGLTLKDQMNESTNLSTAYQMGYYLGNFVALGLLAGGIFLIMWISKKVKKARAERSGN